jgi:hypothetical protein
MAKKRDEVDAILEQQGMGEGVEDGTPAHSMGEKSQATLEGAGNAFSLGFLPQLQARGEQALNAASKWTGLDPSQNTDQELMRNNPGLKIEQPQDNYDTALKYYQQRKAMQQQEMPDQYYGGQLAAQGLMTTPGLIGAARTGIPMAWNAGKAALKYAAPVYLTGKALDIGKEFVGGYQKK